MRRSRIPAILFHGIAGCRRRTAGGTYLVASPTISKARNTAKCVLTSPEKVSRSMPETNCSTLSMASRMSGGNPRHPAWPSQRGDFLKDAFPPRSPKRPSRDQFHLHTKQRREMLLKLRKLEQRWRELKLYQHVQVATSCCLPPRVGPKDAKRPDTVAYPKFWQLLPQGTANVTKTGANTPGPLYSGVPPQTCSGACLGRYRRGGAPPCGHYFLIY